MVAALQAPAPSPVLVSLVVVAHLHGADRVRAEIRSMKEDGLRRLIVESVCELARHLEPGGVASFERVIVALAMRIQGGKA